MSLISRLAAQYANPSVTTAALAPADTDDDVWAFTAAGYDPIAYTYDADVHCPSCALKRFGKDADGFITGTDSEGNPVGIISPSDEWSNGLGDGAPEELHCGTCGDLIDSIEGSDEWKAEQAFNDDYEEAYRPDPNQGKMFAARRKAATRRLPRRKASKTAGFHRGIVRGMGATVNAVQNYLHSNYEAYEKDGQVYIQGTDSAGWTWEDYVVPRLNSGLYGVEEVGLDPITAVSDADIEGVVRCDCGSKYWENGKCIDCGSPAAPYLDQLNHDSSQDWSNARNSSKTAMRSECFYCGVQGPDTDSDEDWVCPDCEYWDEHGRPDSGGNPTVDFDGNRLPNRYDQWGNVIPDDDNEKEASRRTASNSDWMDDPAVTGWSDRQNVADRQGLNPYDDLDYDFADEGTSKQDQANERHLDGCSAYNSGYDCMDIEGQCEDCGLSCFTGERYCLDCADKHAKTSSRTANFSQYCRNCNGYTNWYTDTFGDGSTTDRCVSCSHAKSEPLDIDFERDFGSGYEPMPSFPTTSAIIAKVYAELTPANRAVVASMPPKEAEALLLSVHREAASIFDAVCPSCGSKSASGPAPRGGIISLTCSNCNTKWNHQLGKEDTPDETAESHAASRRAATLRRMANNDIPNGPWVYSGMDEDTYSGDDLADGGKDYTVYFTCGDWTYSITYYAADHSNLYGDDSGEHRYYVGEVGSYDNEKTGYSDYFPGEGSYLNYTTVAEANAQAKKMADNDRTFIPSISTQGSKSANNDFPAPGGAVYRDHYGRAIGLCETHGEIYVDDDGDLDQASDSLKSHIWHHHTSNDVWPYNTASGKTAAQSWVQTVHDIVNGTGSNDFYETGIDNVTAGMLCQIYDALNDANKEKFGNLTLERAVDVGWKLVNKSRTSSRRTADADVEGYFTRRSLPEQLRDAGHTVDATTYDDMIHYIIDGEEMNLRDAADRYLGGFDNAFGAA